MVLTTHRLGALTVDQLRFRYFPTNTRGSQVACYRRVSRLIKGAFLEPNYVPFLANTGRGKALLTLGPQGRILVSQLLGIPRSQIGRVRLDSPVVIPHHLALCDTRLALELACERSTSFILESWVPERELRQSPITVKDPKTGETAPLVPDAAFSITPTPGRTERFFVEQDMGTVPVGRMRPKLRAYLLGIQEPALFVCYLSTKSI